MIQPFTKEQLEEMGYIASRELPDGTILAVGPMAFGNGRLFMDVNQCGYGDFYCFDSLKIALDSMNNYDPENDKEPEGWKRHFKSGRRRENGDPTTEYINF